MAQGGGHRTLLYGHAVLLRHSYSGMVSDTDYIQKHSADPFIMNVVTLLGIRRRKAFHSSLCTMFKCSRTVLEVQWMYCHFLIIWLIKSFYLFVFLCLVPVLPVHLAFIHRQTGFWRGAAGGYHRYLCFVQISAPPLNEMSVSHLKAKTMENNNK